MRSDSYSRCGEVEGGKMTSSRFVRGSKGRLFICLGVVTLFGGMLILYHSTRVELDETRSSLSKSRQELESLAAQLQVIFEFKVRLEKSLQQEKADHRRTKEELQTRINYEQHQCDKENLENINKYSALQQQYKLLQSQHEDLNQEFSKTRSQRITCGEELLHLQTELADLQKHESLKRAELEAHQHKLESENKELLIKLKQLQDVMWKNAPSFKSKNGINGKDMRSSTKEVDTGGNVQNGGRESIAGPQRAPPPEQSSSTAGNQGQPAPARPAPMNAIPSYSKASNKSITTPQINPEALQSLSKTSYNAAPALAPPQSDDHVEESNNNLQGVLPAPLGFAENSQQHAAVPLEAPSKPSALNAESPPSQGQIPPHQVHLVQTGVLPPPPEAEHHPLFHRVRIPGNIHPRQLNPFNVDSGAYHRDFDKFRNIHEPDHRYRDQHIFVEGDNHNEEFQKNGNNFAFQNLNLPKRYVAREENGIQPQNIVPFKLIDHDHYDVQVKKTEDKRLSDLNARNRFNQVADFDSHHNFAPFQAAPLMGDVNHHDIGERNGVDLQIKPHQAPNAHHQAGKIPGPDNMKKVDVNQPLNYHGGDYDKEEHPAQGEDEDDDVDQIDYNNDVANQVPAAPKAAHRQFAGIQQRRNDGVMLMPR